MAIARASLFPDRLAADEGFSVVYFAFAAVVLFGVAALVVDLGSGWRARRSLVPASDAAALAVAQEFAYGNHGCGLYDDYFAWRNRPTVSVERCSAHVAGNRTGWVSVTVTDAVETSFAPVIGQSDLRVESVSTAIVGSPTTLSGLRPIGLCYHGSSGLRSVMRYPPSNGVSLKVFRVKDEPDACGLHPSAPNWLVADFDGGRNPIGDTAERLGSGHPEQVAYEEAPITGCGGRPSCVPADPSTELSANEIRTELDRLIARGTWFTLPVFDLYDPDAGVEGQMRVMGVVRARLYRYDLSGPESEQYLKFVAAPGLVAGTCCGDGGEDSGNRVVALCAVDPADLEACMS